MISAYDGFSFAGFELRASFPIFRSADSTVDIGMG